jgi:hypothetical protein
MSVDAKLANELLDKKYTEKIENGPVLRNEFNFTKDSAGKMYSDQLFSEIKPQRFIPPAASFDNTWKVLAEERAAALLEKQQLLVQFRDEMQAWNEAYLKERERGDRLEKLLVDNFSIDYEEWRIKISELNSAAAPEPIKHTVQSPAQVNRRRANWPAYKKAAERNFSAHDVDQKED